MNISHAGLHFAKIFDSRITKAVEAIKKNAEFREAFDDIDIDSKEAAMDVAVQGIGSGYIWGLMDGITIANQAQELRNITAWIS